MRTPRAEGRAARLRVSRSRDGRTGLVFTRDWACIISVRQPFGCHHVKRSHRRVEFLFESRVAIISFILSFIRESRTVDDSAAWGQLMFVQRDRGGHHPKILFLFVHRNMIIAVVN